MKFTELKNSIAEGAQGVYLLEGEDAYFRTHGEDMIKSAFLTMPELNYAAFEGEALKGANLSSLTAAIQSFPFMAEKRIIKVTEFHPTESDYEKHLKSTLENFPSTCILIIVNQGAKKGAVDLKRKKFVTYVDCSKADEETVVKWIYVTLKRAGVKCDVAACTLIAQYCLSDMSRVSVEVKKLIAYAADGVITKADVDALIYKDAEYRMYEMTNAVARKNHSQFCQIAYELMQRGGDETALLNSLFSYYKNLLTIISSEQTDKELASLLSMKEYGVKKSREQAAAFGEKRLKFFVTSLYSKLSQIKCGEITAESAFRLAIAEIFFKY